MANPGSSGQSQELHDYGGLLREMLARDAEQQGSNPQGEQLVPAPAEGARRPKMNNVDRVVENMSLRHIGAAIIRKVKLSPPLHCDVVVLAER